MKKILSVLVASLLSSAVLAQMQSHTYVSSTGNNDNPGTRALPCATLSAAYAKTSNGGIISMVDPGNYGGLSINKSLTVEGLEGGFVSSTMSTIIINAETNDVVVLRNLTVQNEGAGYLGVSISSAKAVHIDNCRFNGFYMADGIRFEPAVTNMHLFIRNTTVENCSPAGIKLMPAAAASVLIDKCAVIGGGDGIVIGNKVKATIQDTTASGNSGSGILVDAGGKLMLSRGTLSDNLIGVLVSGQAYIANSTITYNKADGVKKLGSGKIRSFGNNSVIGNAPNGVDFSRVTPW
jgi:hypothetical protein